MQEVTPYSRARFAGRRMISDVPIVDSRATILEARKLLLRDINSLATVNYIYIVNRRRVLVGVISIKELFRSPSRAKALSFSPKKLIVVKYSTDQERAARLALKHSLKAIPVVGKDGVLLGVIQSDVILEILDQENEEDLLRFGGMVFSRAYDDVQSLSFATSMKHRLPWLLFGLFGGLFTAGIVHRFEGMLSEHLILASFIPLIVYMAAAVGSQMQAFIIRDFAVHPRLKFARYFFKQCFVVFSIALVVSLLLYGISEWILQIDIGHILAIALFFATLSSLITGLLFPYVFFRLRFDPANATAPVATIAQDILSVFVYLFVASLFL